jgi:hypothetical protein
VFNNDPRETHGDLAADQAYKRDIDIAGMRAVAAAQAGERWDAYHRVVAGTAPLVTWEEARESVGAPDEAWEAAKDDEEAMVAWRAMVDGAREVYRNQSRMQALRASEEFKDSFILNDSPERLEVPRYEFVRKTEHRAIATYAVVIDGEWVSRGKMGWWGLSHDDMDQDEWVRLINELIDGLPDDTLLTIVDCHI